MSNIRVVLFVLLIFLSSCRSNFGDGGTDRVEVIPFSSFSFSTWDNILDVMDAPRYVLLDNEDKDLAFGRIDKVKLHNDKVFILDSKNKMLLEYSTEGMATGRVGTFGQGPDEYLSITDFDVDENGTIAILDGRLDKLFVYDSTRQIISSSKLPFEADIVKCLNNGDYLFGLSAWNTREGSGAKLIRTNAALEIEQSFLEYDEYIDNSFWISNYYFVSVGDAIFYSLPLDGFIYALSAVNGSVSKTYRIDFGSQTLPNAYRKDIERNLPEFDRYMCLKNFTVLSDSLIIGNLLLNNSNRYFIADRRSQICYLSEQQPLYKKTFLTAMDGTTLISYFDSDGLDDKEDLYRSLPAHVVKHLEAGNFVLCLRQVKRSLL